MRKILLLLSLMVLVVKANEPVKLIILADMGNEPDEVQQMVHMVACSNELMPIGLIAVTGKYLHPDSHEEYRRVTHPELFGEIIDAYAKVYPNLQKHADGWHTPAYLKSLVCSGQPGYGIADTGKGKESEGSKLIYNALKKDDNQLIWIVVNAGSNTLAQALIDFKNNHTKAELDKALAKIRVFENGAQDNAGAWICSHFPNIHWIRSNFQTYAYGGPGGTDGDLTVNLGPHFWGDYEYSVSGQNEWLKEHVMQNHGALGDVYPERRYHGFRDGGLGFMEGGGTIPWMGLVNKGLFDINNPNWGGWSGRFSVEKVPDFWSRHKDISSDERKNAPFYVHRGVSDVWQNPKDGKTYYGDYVPVWRWREAMFNDFICRMDWCVKPYDKANHHPIAAVDGDKSDDIVFINTIPGHKLKFDASQSFDPDGDNLAFNWWVYNEAGTYSGNVFLDHPTGDKIEMAIPTGAAGKEIHLILEIKDDNSIASLFDYRRVVIRVANIYDHSRVSSQKD